MYNGTAYAYVKSLQGDIVAILDENGNTVVSYGYDAWGAPLWCTGELAETLGKVQPFRYRGYVFDEETGMYYLRSRYYNAERCRFVNADSVLLQNLFSYCENSPINNLDTEGTTSSRLGEMSFYIENTSDPWKYYGVSPEVARAIDKIMENPEMYGYSIKENGKYKYDIYKKKQVIRVCCASLLRGILGGGNSAGKRRASCPDLGDLITVRDKESGLFGFADYNGNCIISPQYEDVSTHLNGFASFLQDGKWGHIDRMGNICCSPKYDNEYWFNGISFAVSLEQQPLLIDEDGHTLRKFDCHSELSYFTNELILVTNDEGTSLINRLGTDIIEPERKLFIDSERGCNVYEQLIIVKDQQECWGYADLSGNVVCPCIWDSESPFFNGWALVESEKKAFYIDHSMHIVFTFEECDTLLH